MKYMNLDVVYLGNQLVIRINKTKVFWKLKKKLQNRLKGWKKTNYCETWKSNADKICYIGLPSLPHVNI